MYKVNNTIIQELINSLCLDAAAREFKLTINGVYIVIEVGYPLTMLTNSIKNFHAHHYN